MLLSSDGVLQIPQPVRQPLGGRGSSHSTGPHGIPLLPGWYHQPLASFFILSSREGRRHIGKKHYPNGKPGSEEGATALASSTQHGRGMVCQPICTHTPLGSALKELGAPGRRLPTICPHTHSPRPTWRTHDWHPLLLSPPILWL